MISSPATSASRAAWTIWIAVAAAIAIATPAAAASVAASPISFPATARQPRMSRNGSPGWRLAVSSQTHVPRTAGDRMIPTASVQDDLAADRMSVRTCPA